MAKKTSKQVKRKPTEWEKIFVSDTSNRRASQRNQGKINHEKVN